MDHPFDSAVETQSGELSRAKDFKPDASEPSHRSNKQGE